MIRIWAEALALAMVRLARAILPAHLRLWGRAMERELVEAESAGSALGFAFGALWCAVREALAFHLVPRGAPAPESMTAALSTKGKAMHWRKAMQERPRALAALCATAAVGLGLAYMAAAGAPIRNLAINAAALSVGLAVVAMTRAAPSGRVAGGIALVLGALLLASTLAGVRADGAARWFPLGSLFVQPSLIVLPLLLLCFARARDMLASGGVLLAALALALQPDRAMAGALLAGVATLALLRPDRVAAPALLAALAAFAATLVQPDTQSAMPYVDRILYSAFTVHPVAGLAVVLGSALLLLPAIIGWRRDAAQPEVHAAFGAVWLAIVVAAALGNYPTPLVGYSGSAVLGYLFGLIALPARIEPRRHAVPAAAFHESAGDRDARRGNERALVPS